MSRVFPPLLALLAFASTGFASDAAEPSLASPAVPSVQLDGAPFHLSLQGNGGGPEVSPYVRAGALVTMPFDVDLGANVDLDMGYGLQAAVGIARGGDTELRGELQYMYRMADGTDAITFPTFDPILVKTDLTLHSLLLNGQAVFNANGQVSPYIGVGAGISHGVIEVEVDGDSDDDSDTVPEIQVMGGVLLRVNDRWSLDLGVSYTYAFHKLETDSGSDDAPIDVISLAFGIKVRL